MIIEGLKKDPLRLIGLFVCLSALVGAFWFFSRPKNTEQSFPTPSQPIPLFAQGLKIDQTPSSFEPKDSNGAQPTMGGASNGEKVSGSLSNEEIEQTLLKYQRQYQNCWTQGLKNNPKLSGRILLHLTISPRGKVTSIEVPQSEIEDVTMIQCLKSVISRITFSSFEGNPITLSLPLDFN